MCVCTHIEIYKCINIYTGQPYCCLHLHSCVYGYIYILVRPPPLRFAPRNEHSPLHPVPKRTGSKHARFPLKRTPGSENCQDLKIANMDGSVVQCVGVHCSVVQCGAVYCSVVQCGAVYCSVVQCGAVYCSVVQCGAVYCSVVQCGAVYCSVVQCR